MIYLPEQIPHSHLTLQEILPDSLQFQRGCTQDETLSSGASFGGARQIRRTVAGGALGQPAVGIHSEAELGSCARGMPKGN